jgi:hypothetical protein
VHRQSTGTYKWLITPRCDFFVNLMKEYDASMNPTPHKLDVRSRVQAGGRTLGSAHCDDTHVDPPEVDALMAALGRVGGWSL